MRKTYIYKLIVVMLLVLVPQAAYASAGSGDGSGGGASGVSLRGTSIEDGRIEADDVITLNFSSNVVNAEVRENNISAISILDEDGGEVAIEVLMADDQIEPEGRRDIHIKPLDPLPDGAYTLVIDGKLQAKNGSTVGSDIVVPFVAGDPGLTSAAASTDSPAAAAGSGKSNASTFMFICAGITFCALIAVVVVRKKASSEAVSTS